MYHCDKHVVKMVVETAQILCTTSHVLGSTAPYNPIYENHPCRVWSQETLGNWLWLKKLGLCLSGEYSLRFDKKHKSSKVIQNMPQPKGIDPSLEMTPFIQCVPDKFISDDAVEAYRTYYYYDKYQICTYTHAPWPKWLIHKTFKESE